MPKATKEEVDQARLAVLVSASLEADRDGDGNLTEKGRRALAALAAKLADPRYVRSLVQESRLPRPRKGRPR